MIWSATFAFLHHLAAFALVGALAAEMVLFSRTVTMAQARKLRVMDMHFGLAAGLLLVVGILRVCYFEKGTDYYLANGWFIAKISLFVLAGLISIYPTRVFMSWKTALQRGEAPVVTPEQVRIVRWCLMLELFAVFGIILAAPLMARGIGYFG